MSSQKLKIVGNHNYVERLVEICDSSQPNDIARLLNISYQAARNYLMGRLPDSKVLIIISEQTPYSIHWLLTGQGEKFVADVVNADTLLLSDQIRDFVRQTCVEVIGEMLSASKDSSQPKSVVLDSKNIKEEKILDESALFSGKQQ
jgi:hypothetical protein